MCVVATQVTPLPHSLPVYQAIPVNPATLFWLRATRKVQEVVVIKLRDRGSSDGVWALCEVEVKKFKLPRPACDTCWHMRRRIL